MPPVGERDPRDVNLEATLSVADELGVGERGRLVGVMTALAESDLYRYSNPLYPLSSAVPNDGAPPARWAYSTKNSLGLFQQRPQWWGVGSEDDRVRQLMDARVSARLFFTALKNVLDWQTLDPWVAAQAVQRSEYGDGSNYRARMKQAQDAIAGGPRYFTDRGAR
jgi:hypothetical protein